MEFSCLQDNLSKGLANVSRAVAQRAPLPITQNVLIETEDSKIKITATNLEIAISTWISGTVSETGSLTIPARMFTDFINSLPSGEQVEIKKIKDKASVEIKCNSYKGRISGTDSEEFPPIPEATEDPPISVSAASLKKSLRRVALVAATDDSRPVLMGVKIEIAENNITFAAADGFRLAVDKVETFDSPDVKSSAIVPGKTMLEVERLIDESSKENIQIAITDSSNQILFIMDNVQVVSQLIQGQFPDYEKLIPNSSTTQTYVDRKKFLESVRAASIFARDGSGIIKLVIDNGSKKISVLSNAEEIGDLENDIDADIHGEESKVAFNSRFLQDVVSALDADIIRLDTSSPSSPGVFTEKSDGDAGGSTTYRHVIMPMFVQW
ncbi:MAG: DNA polymerase III subunit beta [Actinobacteria bacterium]|jgi:DNA polymerase-3 subunit beta|nr:DNA polymerase III subunit beta [Actinomycetota bacterium]|tara:strand:- start:954 stop:2099 length:1146 start_codon:yes stop_codon:yes gene_type:complete